MTPRLLLHMLSMELQPGMGISGCFCSPPHFTRLCSSPVPKLGGSHRKGWLISCVSIIAVGLLFPPRLILIVANVALIAADLVAIGSGLELITGLSWVWFVIPVGVILWYLTVYRNFETIKKIFIVMSLAFVAYIITAIFSHPNWGEILINTFVPHIDFSFISISSAVALLGATISPYNMFWQVQGEKEEQRAGSTKQKMRSAALDIAIGVISGNLVAYFIIISTASTLFVHHQNITTAADAARSLEPLLGPIAKYLFAVGLIGAGLVAIPVLLASTSYAVAGTFGWPAGLSKKPWQNEGFYLILTGALVVSMVNCSDSSRSNQAHLLGKCALWCTGANPCHLHYRDWKQP